MRSDPVRVVGFDCAEERHVAVLLNSNGEVESTEEVVNSWEAIEETLGRFLLRLPQGCTLRVAVESQRSHGRLVADCARTLGCELIQVNPTALDRFRKVEGVSNKTDPLDAYLLGRIAFFGHGGAREAVEYTTEERALQRLTNLAEVVTQERTASVGRLRALVLEVLPQVVAPESGFPALDSKTMLTILRRWPAFEGLERAHQGTIVRIFRENRWRGDVRGVARSLREMARGIRMPERERRVLAVAMRHEVERILQCNRELRELEEALREAVYQDPDGVRLLEMPGVGLKTAAVILAWYRPVALVSTEAQAAAYSGVTPQSRKSGKSKGRDVLFRRTNKKILRLAYLSAVASLKVSAIDRAYYEKKKEGYQGHPKPHTAAVIALARQRMKVIYQIVVYGERYEKEKLIARHLERERKARVA